VLIQNGWVGGMLQRIEWIEDSFLIMRMPAWVAPLPPIAFSGLTYLLSRWNMRGRCRRCGYDLAGLPAAVGGMVVCPECSRVNAPAKGAA
jgi:hypothetical protein